jgi:hypothetical protein
MAVSGNDKALIDVRPMGHENILSSGQSTEKRE